MIGFGQSSANPLSNSANIKTINICKFSSNLILIIVINNINMNCTSTYPDKDCLINEVNPCNNNKKNIFIQLHNDTDMIFI